jgi:hypothetical protein
MRGCEYLASAVQHFRADGVAYRMKADFFRVDLGARLATDPEYSSEWVRPGDSRWYISATPGPQTSSMYRPCSDGA